MALLNQILQQRGQRLPGDRTLTLGWSTHPRAVALRDALRDRLLDFPGVHAVWIAHARWNDTGVEQLMLHMAVGAEAPEGSSDRLMKSLLADLPASGDADPGHRPAGAGSGGGGGRDQRSSTPWGSTPYASTRARGVSRSSPRSTTGSRGYARGHTGGTRVK